MFEGWASSVVESYLGHFFYVKQEQLRISLWKAWSTGLVLTDLKLKPAAFDHLQLPFSIRGGGIGCLEIQVPWRALGSQPVIVEISDIWLAAAPWPEAEWEEGPASRRAQLAKEASLIAAELSHRAKADSSEREQKRTSWSFLSHLGSLLLNKLQLRVRRVHISFQECSGETASTRLGMQLQTLETQKSGLGSSGDIQAKLCKSFTAEGLSVYLEAGSSVALAAEECPVPQMPLEAPSEDRKQSLHPVRRVSESDMLLLPLDCTASLLADTGVTSLDTFSECVALRVSREQLQRLAKLQDSLQEWSRRSMVAHLRPSGWRSTPASNVPWRRVWIYAIKAVLQKLRAAQGWKSLSGLHEWQQQRRDYIQLYQRHLRSGAAGAQKESKLAALEEILPVAEIMLFRSLAERRSEVWEEQRAKHIDPPRLESSRGWLPGLWSLLGYMPLPRVEEAPLLLSEADIQEMYKELDLDPQIADRSSSSSLRLALRVPKATLLLAEFPGDAGQVAEIEAAGISAGVDLSASGASAEAQVRELALLDLCSPGDDRQAVVRLWQQGADGNGHETAPMAAVTYNQAREESTEFSRVGLIVQPLHIELRLGCFSRLANIVLAARVPQGVEERRVAACNCLETHACRLSAKAEMLAEQPPHMRFHVQIVDVLISQADAGLEIQTGRLELESAEQQHPLTDLEPRLQSAASKGAQPGDAVDDVAVQIAEQVLYTKLQLGIARLRLNRLCPPESSVRAEAILLPMKCSARIWTSRLPDLKTPALRVSIQASALELACSPEALACLTAASAQFEPPREKQTAVSNAQEARAVVHLEVPSFSLTFKHLLAEGDAAESHVGLAAQRCSVSLTFYEGGIYCKTQFHELHARDSSVYTASPPPLRGRFPRLVRELQIDDIGILVTKSAAEGLLVSGELIGALALGFDQEVGNFISRGAPDMQPTCRFTHRRDAQSAETNITLQDGCFGAATLMRLAALVVPSLPPDDSEVRDDLGSQDTEDLPAQNAPSGHDEHLPTDKAERLSVEILRCRAVCPDWQDTEVSISGRPDVIVLGIPYLLLQLPALDPAHHPRTHPVQACLDSTSGNLDEGAADRCCEAARPIVIADRLTLQVAVFDRGKVMQQPADGMLLGIASIQATCSQGETSSSTESFVLIRLVVPTVHIAATPRQLKVMASVAEWAQKEFDRILGRDENGNLDGLSAGNAGIAGLPSEPMLGNPSEPAAPGPGKQGVEVSALGDTQQIHSSSAVGHHASAPLSEALTCNMRPAWKFKGELPTIKVQLHADEALQPVLACLLESLRLGLTSDPRGAREGEIALTCARLRFLELKAQRLQPSLQVGASPMREGESEALLGMHKDRFQRAASAPVPQLLDLFSRTVSTASIESGSRGSPFKFQEEPAEGPLHGDALRNLSRADSVQVSASGLADFAALSVSQDPIKASRAAAWGAGASRTLEQMLPPSSPTLSRQGSASSARRWLPQSSVTAAGSVSATPSRASSSGLSDSSTGFVSAHSTDDEEFKSASSGGNWGSGSLANASIPDPRTPPPAPKLVAPKEVPIWTDLESDVRELIMVEPAAGSQSTSEGCLRLSFSQTPEGELEIRLGGVRVRATLADGEVAVSRLKDCMLAAASPSFKTSPAEFGKRQRGDAAPVRCASGPILVELLASPSADGAAPVPCMTLSTSLKADAQRDSFGRLGMQMLEVRKFGISMSLVEAQQGPCKVGTAEDAGVIMGIKDMQIVFEKQPSRVLREGKITVTVGRASVWASSKRLCILSAFLSAARGLRTLVASSNVLTSNPGGLAQRFAELPSSWSLSVGVLAVALSGGPHEAPLLEAAILSAAASTRSDDGLQLVHLEGQVWLNAYAATRRGWEAVVEPWTLGVQAERATMSVEAGRGQAPGQLLIAVSSKSPLELTARRSTSEVLRAACTILERAVGVGNQPQTLLHVIDAQCDEDLEAAGELSFQVQNMSGEDLHFWSELDMPFEGTRQGGGHVLLAHGESKELHAEEQGRERNCQQLAGRPDSFFEDDKAFTASTLHHNRSVAELLAIESNRSKMLYFQLNCQEDQCGPIPLDISHASPIQICVAPGRVAGAPSLADVICSVEQRPNAACLITIHSGIKIKNYTRMEIELGLQRSGRREPPVLGSLAPGQHLYLPVLRPEPGLLCVRPICSYGSYGWSAGIRVQPLLNERRRNQDRIARQVSCDSPGGGAPALKFNFGFLKAGQAAGCEIAVRAPLVLQNSLPVPADVTLKLRGEVARHLLDPQEEVPLHAADIGQVQEVVIRPLGYQWAPPLGIPNLPDPVKSSGSRPLEAGGFLVENEGEGRVTVTQAGEGQGSTTVLLRHILEGECGSHILCISCALWLYNCAGLPLAIRQGEEEADAEEGAADEVPQQWLPQFEGRHKYSARHAAAPRASALPISRAPSKALVHGLGQALDQMADGFPTRFSATRETVHGSTQSQILPKPLASHPVSASWPSMPGGFQMRRRRLSLQLRASQMKAPQGMALWSTSVRLDALGGAAVVSVPCPLPGPGPPKADCRAAVVLAVTAAQAAGGDGALAVYVMPRYVLHNALNVPIQYKQQGTNVERELRAGCKRAVHWPDRSRPLLLCVRMHDAGWQWSGGVSLDTPGDLFVKIRHKDRGVTVLWRMDVSTSSSGMLAATLSDHAGGFAPYRVDNCTSQILHLSQLSYREQEDVLRPYSSLRYAWDEPALPHKLVIALPGNRTLGAFDLDKVGYATQLSLRGLVKMPDEERKLQVLVRAEGPTRVMSVIDLRAHLPLSAVPTQATSEGSVGWEAWSGSLSLSPSRFGQVAVPPADLDLEVRVEVAGIGLSVISGSKEIAYARASGIMMRVAKSMLRSTFEICVQTMQVDNTLQTATYAVMLASPTVPLRAGIGVVADTKSSRIARSAAFTSRIAVWRRQPTGVLCVELLEVRIAPLALEAEQHHMTSLLQAGNAIAGPFHLGAGQQGRQPQMADLGILRGGSSVQRMKDAKLCIERLSISKIAVTFSFLPVDWSLLQSTEIAKAGRMGARVSLGLQRLLSLVGEVEGGCIRLGNLELQHRLLSLPALMEQISSHYTRAAFPELVKLLGSANILGDPVSLFQHLGLGIWSLVASPAVGLVESARGNGPRHITDGFAEGLQSLFSNVVFALSNATAKASTSAQKLLILLGAEHGDASGLPLRQRRHRTERDRPMTLSLVGVLLEGLIGLLSEPVRGYDESGALGLVVGTYRGVIGALLKPIASLLETCARVADSFRKVVMGPAEIAPRVRPPRFVSATGPLSVYDRHEAVGRYVLNEASCGKFAHETLLFCQPLRDRTRYVLLTLQHMLQISWPGLRFLPTIDWEMSVADVLSVRREKTKLHVLALRSFVCKGSKPSRARQPFISEVLQLKSIQNAQSSETTVAAIMAKAQTSKRAHLWVRCKDIA